MATRTKATTPKTTPSTRRLSEVARHVVIPSGIVTTGWPAVEKQCRKFGDEFDAWQQGAGSVMLGRRADGIYAATVGGITLSIPRQVAKTFLVGRIIFALCVLFPGLKVVWTAHRTRTATQTFRTLSAYAKRAKVAPHIAANGIRKTNGEQEIAFANGSIIMFGARELGFGRGFDEVDVEVFDEAQILTVRALEDMVAATNQSRHPHGALLFYMGTPPRPIDPGEAFALRREEALAFVPDGHEFGAPVLGEDAVYIECSADRGANPDDEAQWSKANPSYPHRTPKRSMLRLRKNLPGVDSWLREALGIWDEVDLAKVGLIDVDEWTAPALQIAAKDAPATGVRAYGIKFSPDGATVAVSVALKSGDSVHIEGVFHRSMLEGTRWLIDWLKPRWGSCAAIVVDGKAGAGAFIKGLRAERCPPRKIIPPTAEQAVTAHREFLDAVIDKTLTHIEDQAFADSVASSGRRPIGAQGGFGFQSIDGGDVTLAESAVFAHFGATGGRQPRSTSSGQSGRRAVVLT